MELVAVLRQLAEALEKGSSPLKFDINDAGTREALESLFNTWYERAYKEVEEQLDTLDSGVDKLKDKFDELPGDLDGHDGRIEDVESEIEELKSKIKDIDIDAIEDAVQLARDTAKAVSRLDVDELGEMTAFFRAMKAHFSARVEREAA